jgi:hypothetical protein
METKTRIEKQQRITVEEARQTLEVLTRMQLRQVRGGDNEILLPIKK